MIFVVKVFLLGKLNQFLAKGVDLLGQGLLILAGGRPLPFVKSEQIPAGLFNFGFKIPLGPADPLTAAGRKKLSRVLFS